MKLTQVVEPELEFGRGLHVCPRAGISQFEVFDTKFKARRDRILVGAVGSGRNIDGLKQWLDRCARPILPKLNSKQPNLFTGFCGFNNSVGFRATLVLEDEITRRVNNSDLTGLLSISDRADLVTAAVDLYYRQVKFLAQNRQVDVIVCVIPDDLFDAVSITNRPPVEEMVEENSSRSDQEFDFRRALKARTMHLGVPLQLLRERTLEPHGAGQQDAATKAWNFAVALYYKANQTVPWRLPPNPNRPRVCYVGVGFYRSRDKQVIHTSTAQIFDELGNGVILRGTPVSVDKDDKRPYLTGDQSGGLLRRVLEEYAIALEGSPARLVVHKTSNYRPDELEGFRDVARAMGVASLDFVTILDSDMRLFRQGSYPPYRGTQIALSSSRYLLYTRGSVDYYKTYTGLYVPQPLEIRLQQCDESPDVICREVLALTKMNWNNSQFDGKYPITLTCARKVGEVMKYLGPDDNPQISYSFYM